jgi:radical SAM-linked protein
MRLRITFAKQGALRYTGHLDLHKIWERSIRRAKLPLAYSQGFHPQPKINLAAALPLGFSSRAEVMDVWLSEEVDNVPDVLQGHMPPGLTILDSETVNDRAPSLQSQVIAAEYEVEITEAGFASGLTEKIASVLESKSIPRVRRKKEYDLRPLIEELAPLALSGSPKGVPHEGAGGEEGRGIYMRLTAREGATGRPEEVLAVLEIPLEATRIERTCLLFRG